MPIYNAKLLEINKAELLRYAGLHKVKNIDEKILNEVCEEAKLLIKIRGIWKIYNYNCEKQKILSEPPVKIEGKSIENHLKLCEKVICVAVTIGEDITNEVTAHFNKGNYFFSILLDAAATTIVEQVADEMEKYIEPQILKEGYKMKWRFSPGYGDWSLNQQPDLFKLAGAEEIEMKLSESLMLIPRKSITAIIGLIKNNSYDKKNNHKSDCANCDKIECISRKIE